MRLQKISPWLVGLIQALAIVLYILLFASFAQTNLWSSGIFYNQLVTMAFMLMLFVFSALLCGGAALGYPLVLLFEKKITRAVHIICWTGFWIGTPTVVILFILAITSTNGSGG